ncbi:MAG TPA: hypothetical protein VJQ58_07915, partial [Burkholderiales bacterium]|nr:hypothetical protein [Burkholderiales bacterium]
EFIDADNITSDSGLNITLNGAEGTHVVTVENLHGNLFVAGNGLTVNAFAVNNSGEGGYMLAGDDGHDILSVEGDSEDILAGGLGNDTLSGGAGNDWFAFDSAPGAANIDTIVDFETGFDRIALDSADFGALMFDGEGNLVGGQFKLGAATDSDDRLIYDENTGALYYDADGNGVGAAVQFAQLGGGDYAIPEINEADIVQLLI